ncbi:GGDEF domain-containing protein [Clostridium sp. SHJSY1]|uniref:sensor domain-containing diguanylate cyclase n=1 Tax=Clostridium sp. SHJSY1 TaxID=2942483 RepID=UPI002874A082|nr:GGDEF domain-containing protein [Clostridium sp. SHJSY1]MDS0525286.1 GGDEF domain-containing protein [Clostridium sp. SHJSY1]
MDTKDVRKEIDALLEKANELRYADSRKTIEVSKNAVNLCKRIGYILGEKVANLYMSYAYNQMGDNEKSLNLIFNSLNYFIEEGFYDLEWMSYNILGIIFFNLSDIERSMDFYQKARTVSVEIDMKKKYHKDFTSKTAIVMSLNNIAENYKALKEYRKALSYCKEAYNIDKQFEYSLTKGMAILSLGEIYYVLGEYDKANKFSHKALECLEKYHCFIGKADTYKLMALTSWKKGDYKKADEYFLIAMDLNEKESVPAYKIDALISFYEYLKDREKSVEALKVLKNACDLSIRHKIPEKVTEISILLAIFYGDLGDYKQSYKYTKLHCEYEKNHNKSYYKNIINSLNIKKKMQDIEKENDKIAEKNKDLKTLVEKISIISELGQKITSTLNKDSIMYILYLSIRNFMDLSYFAIGLYDEENSMLNYLGVIDNGKKKKKESLQIKDESSYAGKCIRNREILIINNSNKEVTNYMEEVQDNQLKLDNNKLNSFIFCPLIVSTKVIGVITIQSKEKNAFTPYRVEMIKSLSSYAAIAINNAIKSAELENLNQVLLSLSEKDKLTDIANRRKFDDYMNNIWDISIKKQESIALILIDIDYFKEYNDNYGHLEGDKCIAAVANTLANLNNREYFVARYGGDEFVIILRNCTIEEAIKFGENIKNKISERNIIHEFSKISDRVTLSIGVTSIIPNKNIAINEVIRKADDALYITKKRGRNNVSACEF